MATRPQRGALSWHARWRHHRLQSRWAVHHGRRARRGVLDSGLQCARERSCRRRTAPAHQRSASLYCTVPDQPRRYPAHQPPGRERRRRHAFLLVPHGTADQNRVWAWTAPHFVSQIPLFRGPRRHGLRIFVWCENDSRRAALPRAAIDLRSARLVRMGGKTRRSRISKLRKPTKLQLSCWLRPLPPGGASLLRVIVACNARAATAAVTNVATGAPLVRCQLPASEFYRALKRELRTTPESAAVEPRKLAAAANLFQHAITANIGHDVMLK